MTKQITQDIKIVNLEDVIDLENRLDGRFAVRVPEDLLNLWKWIINSMESEASAELRKLVYRFCEGKLSNSFNDKFVRESICPNCQTNVGAPWLLPKHEAMQCSYTKMQV